MVSDRLHRIRTRHTEFTSAHAQECARFNCSLSVLSCVSEFASDRLPTLADLICNSSYNLMPHRIPSASHSKIKKEMTDKNHPSPNEAAQVSRPFYARPCVDHVLRVSSERRHHLNCPPILRLVKAHRSGRSHIKLSRTSTYSC
jgi:hypothetical protein